VPLEEIPAIYNGTGIFAGPISYEIKSQIPCSLKQCGSPTGKLGGESHDPAMLPIDKVQIKTLHKSDIDLGKSIYQEAAG
jgi:hypothetical protein